MNRRMRKRLTDEEKRAIWILVHTTKMKKTKIADLFGITRSRVSQIINNTYGEHESLGLEFREEE